MIAIAVLIPVLMFISDHLAPYYRTDFGVYLCAVLVDNSLAITEPLWPGKGNSLIGQPGWRRFLKDSMKWGRTDAPDEKQVAIDS